ncbi:MAG: Flp pilus assembly complex ATPase component TadA [Lachnospiraceae bacterium]|nr:Flp pilus assembly complex ATPase component TadA [Lachnospiraceae bacterium]
MVWIVIILFFLIPAILLLITDPTGKKHTDKDGRDNFGMNELLDECRIYINDSVCRDYSELYLNREETLKREKQQARLKTAIREACLGDAGDREYLKEYIKDFLQKKMKVTSENINRFIRFNAPYMMSAQDKFEHMYECYSEKYGNRSFAVMARDFGWAEGTGQVQKDTPYCITEKEVEKAYDDMRPSGSFTERLEVLAQRIYQRLYGHDCADILIMDESVDGVSAGVGGRSRVEYDYMKELNDERREKPQSMNYETVYCVLHGKLIRMGFLSFEKEENLKRVVKNIYRYNIRTNLSRKNPVIHGTLKNGSRIVAARPPVSDGWVFYLRKFKSSDARRIDTLITHKNGDTVIELLKLITGGELNFCISGPMGGGKTTLLKSLVGFMNPKYTIRVAESSFELNLNNVYPERNIHMMQERGDFTIYDIITGTKKMDTDILIVGEVNEPKIAGAYVQVAQSGSRMAVTTLHHETTDKLIEYLRNALVSELGINDVRIAEKQVVDILNFDIHMVHDVDGNFYIERITEIIPETTDNMYRLSDIVRFDKDNMEYRFCTGISEHTREKIIEKTGMARINDWDRFFLKDHTGGEIPDEE